MRRGFRIGRIFGINIRIDWSWILIFLLISWSLSSEFGNIHQDWGIVLRWGTAVVAALLFFASVLAHELAHSLVAKSQGVPVRSITLFLFGGVSNIRREPSSPGGEFFMAILGPLTSFVVGFILIAAVGFSVGSLMNLENISSDLSQLGPVTTLLLWLGSINITLGVFNLIPGFPLDGGRVLRSILWAIMDDLRRATRWASFVGQGIAWLMIMAGISMVFGMQIPYLGTGVANGVWLAFIGWFLNTASARSYRQVVIHDILEDVPVTRMMRQDPPTVPPDVSIDALIDDHIMKSDDQAFPVLDEAGNVLGIVTLDDVRTVSRDERSTTNIRQIMTPLDEMATLSPEDEASGALQKLVQRDVRQLPVLKDGQNLAGLLRRRDIIKWLQLESDLNLG
jgi:Zn-dependent protease